MTPTKKGYAVQMSATKRGGWMFTLGKGANTTIWHTRGEAVDFKRELSKHQIKCRVVEVRYADPVVVEK